MAGDVATGFPDFFAEVTSREPFEWQADLTDELVAGRVPDVMVVPTGFGKTSVIVCWAYALAHAAPEMGLPRRLCFVVDRRLVVDASYENARDLADRLVNPDGRESLERVAASLRRLHGDPKADPLAVVRMRGGVTWDSRWLARPDQAAVIAGTVDQFGSRLLFRGYGVSENMRPIDAALVGTDSWLVVDEAHLAGPLVATARAAAKYQAGAEIGRPLRVTQMSATVEGTERGFRADPDVQRHSTRFPQSAAAAAQRLDAVKPARLVDLKPLKSGNAKRRAQLAERLGHALADLAREVDQKATVVGVIVNTIGTARAAYERLAAKGEEACLLIGRSRAFERDQIIDEFQPRLQVGADRSRERHLFVVATQTIEVGANFDLDAIITECAPLSSLIQRFGRVNRIGARDSYESLVVHAGFFHDRDNDLIYGSSTSATWVYLSTRAAAAEADVIDFGLGEVATMIAEAPDAVRPAPPLWPQLLGAHVERWAATRPAPYPDQVVDPFLHGFERVVPEVSVAWRAAPPRDMASVGSDKELAQAWGDWLELVRPIDWEFVSVPIWEAQGLVADAPSSLPTADLAGAMAPTVGDEPAGDGSREPVGVVYGGPNEVRLVRWPRDLAPGDRLVLDATVGGHDRWGWTGLRPAKGQAVADVTDLAPARPRASLRLDASGAVLASLATEPDAAEETASLVRQLVATLYRDAEVDGAGRLDPDAIATTLGKLVELPFPRIVRERLGSASNTSWPKQLVPDTSAAGRALLLLGPATKAASLDAMSDDDEASTSSTPIPQTLDEHGKEVRNLADGLARNLTIPREAARAVVLAAYWHDLGKADARFQRMLYDGDAVAAGTGEPRAKSGRDWRDPIARRALAVSGVPRGFRHEAVSGRLARALMQDRPELTEDVDEDLLHHLIVSHHGWARPLLPGITDHQALPVQVQVDGRPVSVPGQRMQVDWEHPGRFEALNRRYGWWGLAFLEALVRLADMECSAHGGRS